MKKYLFLFILLISSAAVFAIVDTVTVPIYRQLFHDKINEEQRLLDKLDGTLDGVINVTHNVEINFAITDIMMRKINELEDFVELNNRLSTNNQKIRYLGYIENVVKTVKYSLKSKELNPVYVPLVIENFEKIMIANIDSFSMASEILKAPYQVGNKCGNICRKQGI